MVRTFTFSFDSIVNFIILPEQDHLDAVLDPWLCETKSLPGKAAVVLFQSWRVEEFQFPCIKEWQRRKGGGQNKKTLVKSQLDCIDLHDGEYRHHERPLDKSSP